MTVTIPIQAIQFNPGSSTTINNLTWQEFETILEVYAVIGVPEVWIYRKQQLKIYSFVDGSYQEQSISPTFPNLPLTTLIPQLVQQAINEGTSRMLRKLRNTLSI